MNTKLLFCLTLCCFVTSSHLDLKLGTIKDKTFNLTLKNTALTMDSLNFFDEYSKLHVFPLPLEFSPKNKFSTAEMVLILTFKKKITKTGNDSHLTGIAYFGEDKIVSFSVRLFEDRNTSSRVLLKIPAGSQISNFKHSFLDKPIISLTHYLFDVSYASTPKPKENLRVFQNGNLVETVTSLENPEKTKENQLYQLLQLHQEGTSITFELANEIDSLKDFTNLADADLKQFPQNKIQFSSCEGASKEILLFHKNKIFYFSLINPMFYSCEGLEAKLKANKKVNFSATQAKTYNFEDKLFTFSFGIANKASSAYILLALELKTEESTGISRSKVMLVGIARTGIIIDKTTDYSFISEIEADSSDNIAVGLTKNLAVSSPDIEPILAEDESVTVRFASQNYYIDLDVVSLKILEISEGVVNFKYASGETNTDLDSMKEILRSQRAIHLYPYTANQAALPFGFTLLEEVYYCTELFPLEKAASINEFDLIEYYEENNGEVRIEPSFNYLYSSLRKTGLVNKFTFQFQTAKTENSRNLSTDSNSYRFSINNCIQRKKSLKLEINQKDLIFPVYTQKATIISAEPTHIEGDFYIYRLAMVLFYKNSFKCTQVLDYSKIIGEGEKKIYLLFRNAEDDFTCYLDSNPIKYQITKRDRAGQALSFHFISPNRPASNANNIYESGKYPTESSSLWEKMVPTADSISTKIGTYSLNTRIYAINMMLQTKPNEWIFIPRKKITHDTVAGTETFLKETLIFREASNLVEISDVTYLSIYGCFKITTAVPIADPSFSFEDPTYLYDLTGIYVDGETNQSQIIQGKNCENVVQFMKIGNNVFYDIPSEMELPPLLAAKFFMVADYHCLKGGNNGIFDKNSFANFKTNPATGERENFLEVESEAKKIAVNLRLSSFIPNNTDLVISPGHSNSFEVNTVFKDINCLWIFKSGGAMTYRSTNSCRTLSKSSIPRLIFFFDAIDIEVELSSIEIAKAKVNHQSLKPNVSFSVTDNKITDIKLDCLFDTLTGTIYYLCGKEPINDLIYRQKLPKNRIPRAINSNNYCVFTFVCSDRSGYFYREDRKREGFNLFEREFVRVSNHKSERVIELPSDIPPTKKAKIEGNDLVVETNDIFVDITGEVEEFKNKTDQEKIEKLKEITAKNSSEGNLNSFIDIIVVAEVTNKVGESLPVAETQSIVNSNNKTLKDNITAIDSENEDQLLAASQALAVSSEATLKTAADPKILLEANMNLNKKAESKGKISKDTVLKVITGVTRTNSNLIKTTVDSDDESKEQGEFEKNLVSTVTESTLLLEKLEDKEVSITAEKLKISKVPLKNEAIKFPSEDGAGFLATVNYDEYPVKLEGRAKVKAINFIKEQKIQEVKDLKEPVEFILEKNLIDQKFCVYYDKVKDGWSSEGCTSEVISPRQIKCSCTHLTDFSLLDYNPYFIARDAYLIFIGANFMKDLDFLFEFSWESTFILRMYGWICLAHLFSLILACLYDRRDPDLLLVEVNKIYGLCSYEELIDNLEEVRQISQEIVDIKKKERICEYLKKADKNEIARKITVIDPDQEAQPVQIVPKLRLLSRMKEEIKRQSEENNEAELNLLATAMLHTLRKAKTKKGNHLLRQNLSKQDLKAIKMNSLYFYRYFALTNFFLKTEYPLVSLFVPSDSNTTKANLVNMFFFQMYLACGVAAIVTPENQEDFNSGNMEDKFNSYDVATTFIVLVMVDIPFMLVEVLLRKNQVIENWIPELKFLLK